MLLVQQQALLVHCSNFQHEGGWQATRCVSVMLQEAAAELAMLVEPVFSSKHEPVVLQLCDVLVKLYTAYPVQNGQDQNARVSRDHLGGDALSWLQASVHA